MTAPLQPLPAGDRARLQTEIESIAPQITALAQTLWDRPELGYAEVQSSAAMQQVLARAGFTVEAGVAGLPTAFTATWGAGRGPVIGLMAEMDALPGFSQDAVPHRAPRPGVANGHACGHHLFGAGSIGAAIALARWLEATGCPGEVRLYGTPAEEGGAGKVFMARAGLFDDLDIALHWHPDDRNTVWQSRSLASIGAKFRFHGVSAHAAQSPDKGRSALHGVEAFHHMASLLREVVPQGTHIHYVVSQGGQAPNVIPDMAESHLGVRHPLAATAAEVFARIEAAAQGAALGTGTRVEVTRLGAVHSILPNDTLGRVMDANMRNLPPLRWDDDDVAFARSLQTTLTDPPGLDGIDRIDPYVFDRQGAFSSDMGDVSWLAPCAALGTVTWVPGTRPHTWQAVAAGGTAIAWKGMTQAALALAATAAHLLRAPELIARAQAEFHEARGADFTYRPLVGDAPPPCAG